MGAVAEVWLPGVDQSDVRLVYQGGGVEGMLGGSCLQTAVSEMSEVLTSVPGLVARPLGTDDLTLLLWGRSPMVMIDGARALPGDLRLLYPWEIAGVEVRRDVPSTAIFGSPGEAGVVLVTTKRTRGPKF